MSFFHARGVVDYGAAVRVEYESERRALETRLRQAETDDERTRLADELRELKTKYRAMTAHRGYFLF